MDQAKVRELLYIRSYAGTTQPHPISHCHYQDGAAFEAKRWICNLGTPDQYGCKRPTGTPHAARAIAHSVRPSRTRVCRPRIRATFEY